MAEYDDLGKSFVPGKNAPNKCKSIGATAKMASQLKEAAEPVEAIKGLFSNPLSILERANAKQKLAYATKVDELQTKIDSAKTPTEKVKYETQLETVHSEAIERISSMKVEDLAIKSDLEYEARMVAYMDDSLEDFGNFTFDELEGNHIQNVLGKENEKFTTDYVLNKMLKDVKAAGGVSKYRAPTEELAKYIEEYGEEAITKTYTTAKLFNQLGKAAGLKEERYLKNYFPKLFEGLEETADSKILKDMAKGLGNDESARRLKAFFDQKRTGEFATSERTVPEIVGIYMQGIRKKIRQRYADEISKSVLENSNHGLNVKELDAVKTLVENFVKIDPPDKASEFVHGITKAFYRASLMNNVGSTLNNLSAIPNLVGARYGIKNTIQALGHMNTESSLTRFLDDMNIGSNKEAFSVFNAANTQGALDKADPLLKFDLFNKSEQISIRTAAIAGLIKKYNGLDNALLRVEKANTLKGQAKIDALLKIGADAKSAVMDTIFTNISGNKGKIYSGSSRVMAEIVNAGMAFLRHPTREAKFVWGHLENSISPKTATRKQAVDTLSKYFFAKSMLLGRNAMFFALPAPIMNFIDDNVPQVRQVMETAGMVLETLAIPKMALGAIGIDYTLGQNLMWWWEPFYDLVAGEGGQSPIPIMRYAQGVADSWQKVFEGKAETRHWARALSALTFVKGGYLEFGGVPIGANQLRKVGELAGSLLEGKMNFWGVEQELESFNDYKEAVGRAAFSLTPTKSKIILAKSKESGHYRDYLLSLSKLGQKDSQVFKELVKAYNGDTKKAKKSLLDSLSRRKKDYKSREMSKMRRTINGYSR